MIPYGRQQVTQADIDAVVAVLRSDFLTQGPLVPRFESRLAAYCGVAHALAVNSGTSALHIACLALGIGKGDWVWTSPITFVASANCALYCGASVDFVDIDPCTYNMCPQALAAKLVVAEREKRLPKAVVVVHLSGQPCDLKSIHDLSKRYGFRVIEDASHAIGARYCNEPIGNCRYSDITVFSFHPVKIVTTAEGGAACTNDAALAERLALYRSHGITRDPKLMTRAPDGPWYYEQLVLGFNYRMTDMQAALGLSQFDRLDEYVRRRHEIAAGYDQILADLPVIRPWQDPDGYSAYHLYVVRLKTDEVARTHGEVFASMRESGIGVNVHYIPVYTQPFFQEMGFRKGQFPEAERYYGEAISLPIFPALTASDQDAVVDALKSALQG
ncbi:MAG TPA: UDP-4-amino-4,6-dideoxy-N-acetyl-beta-L-altrosamine transaminase [Pseudolabrys sp.]|nr:UDP-4-amino-4,6-dideoxy-N-acetyl-beta-L-altrosamine transaminase [Pseudolabrys sp.]